MQDANEQEQISSEGVKLIPTQDILHELTQNQPEHSFAAAAAGEQYWNTRVD